MKKIINFKIEFLLKKCEIDSVEIDGEIAKAAKDWYGLVEDNRTHVYVEDGLKFIENASKMGKKMGCCYN